ncbi:IclR family transcriptional regulator [Halalkalibacillus sediminis]|uniref:IclR family transcriptional regulator n=1 Tax=Halalkalibacillus sediminis TaxID=2018042 RepID=A0A2I0QUB1_9BACI|nr:IclR family transcriptional regulator [Halalkalibacillus sediminis]PKR77898.1 IclR family transcriptional regulator [Halalkalibacillus sediminis]
MSKSLVKAIGLLDYFKIKQNLSLVELAQLTGMPKTTIYRLVNSLEEAGLLIKDRNSQHDVQYRLGIKLLELGKLVEKQLTYKNIALPFMKRLNDELEELVHLTIIEGDEAVYIETIGSKKHIRLVVKVGERAPLYAGSAPKLLLSSKTDEEIYEYFKRVPLNKRTPNTIDNEKEIMKEIYNIREEGYSISRSESFKDTIGFSAPIYDFTGKIVAALGVSTVLTTFEKEKQDLILEKVQSTAEKISYELGYNRID